MEHETGNIYVTDLPCEKEYVLNDSFKLVDTQICWLTPWGAPNFWVFRFTFLFFSSFHQCFVICVFFNKKELNLQEEKFSFPAEFGVWSPEKEASVLPISYADPTFSGQKMSLTSQVKILQVSG